MYKRATLPVLLLLVLMVGTVVTARADTIITDNFSINWTYVDASGHLVPAVPPTTNGTLVLDITTQIVLSYDIPVPAPFPEFMNGDGLSYALFLPCPAPGGACFEIQIGGLGALSGNYLKLYFAGDPSNYQGAPFLQSYSGYLSQANCKDPCQYFASATTTPEPASILLLGCGLLLAAGVLRRKMRR